MLSCPFPTTIVITPRAPPYKYIYVYIYREREREREGTSKRDRRDSEREEIDR